MRKKTYLVANVIHRNSDVVECGDVWVPNSSVVGTGSLVVVKEICSSRRLLFRGKGLPLFGKFRGNFRCLDALPNPFTYTDVNLAHYV